MNVSDGQRSTPTIDDLKRAERLWEALSALAEVNRRCPVIVEGKKDARALRKLGLRGEIVTLHRGKGLYEFCEDVADRFPKVVLLLDWDSEGENLYRTVAQNLSGHWEEFIVFRDLLKILCQKDVKDVEGIPKLLSRLGAPDPPESGGRF